MADTKAELAAKIREAFEFSSDNPEVDIEAARQQLANDIAQAVEDYVLGRQVQVPGIQPGPGTTTGTILNL